LTSKSKNTKLPWNRDTPVTNGRPAEGFTINTGINEIHNETPVSPKEVKREIKVTDRDIGVLFPSLLFKSRVADRDFLNDIKEKVLKATKDPDMGTVSGRAEDPIGWYSYDDLHQREGFDEVHDFLLKESAAVFAYYDYKVEEVYLTAMWANVGYNPYYCHMNHTHPNSLFSGVLHVSVPNVGTPYAQTTTFSDPRPAARVIEPNVNKDFAAHNSGTVSPIVKNGSLLMFPSWLPHGVQQQSVVDNQGIPRITISFNAMMVGDITTRTAPIRFT
tara:strand:+ start:1551 stop:2372 length:822 start_codon:yes stop_codon:yes gene_type:complete